MDLGIRGINGAIAVGSLPAPETGAGLMEGRHTHAPAGKEEP